MFDATNPLADAHVNLFANAYKPVPVATLMLAEAIEAICGGRYQREVCEVRQVLAAKGKRTYNKAKATIPAFTFAGTFSPSRANEHLQQHAGIAHGDMDYVEDIASAKRRICSDPRTAYAFDSPGGQGLKVGVRVLIIADDAAYKHVWRIVSAEYERLYRRHYSHRPPHTPSTAAMIMLCAPSRRRCR
jgi:hypothetical protein